MMKKYIFLPLTVKLFMMDEFSHAIIRNIIYDESLLGLFSHYIFIRNKDDLILFTNYIRLCLNIYKFKFKLNFPEN